MENSKSILELTHDEAHKYFLKQESYCGFDLPVYFKFEPLLESINEAFNEALSDGGPLKWRTSKVCDFDDVNYKILSNKDGRHAWRLLQLVNPVIYVSLVREITSPENWEKIQKRFGEFAKNEKIKCLSIPRTSLTNDSSDKAEQILNWWHHIEQSSIEMALDYSCLMHTDLTDCYGAIYTHSVAWAIHEKEDAKKNRGCKNFVGNQIDRHLQYMSHGQTNGIPQGSSLMDFIAEMVLGYADLKLGQLLEKENIKFNILRYRDDYRIFSNSPIDNDRIVKRLAEVMIDLGLKLSKEKTKAAINVVKDSIKSDKLYWMKQKQMKKNLQKHLLVIHDLSMQFPNCGSLPEALCYFHERLCKRKKLREGIIPLISIVTDIAHKNPRIYKEFTAIISSLLQFEADASRKRDLLEKVIKKFENIPNTGHLEIWIQRVIFGIKDNVASAGDKLREPLGKLANGESIKVWNFDWLPDSLKRQIDISSIIDEEKKRELSEIITRDEVALFKERHYRYA